MTRDCEHGRQQGKCADCDVTELEQENRLLRARNKRLRQCEEAFNVWIDKTAWVQESARPGELGLHRADVLKARIDRLERELALAESMHKVAVQQRDQAWGELTQLAESVAQRLEQAGAGMQAGLIREVFIAKSHP